MVSAVTSSSFSFPGAAAKSTAALEAQHTKYQAELADWVNCSSCNTPEGKAKIAEISDKIKFVEQRIQAIESKQPSSAARAGNGLDDSVQREPPRINEGGIDGPAATASTLATRYATNTGPESNPLYEPAASTAASSAITGSQINVFA